MGWDNPFQGITMHQVNHRNYELITEYGQVPYDAIKTQSEEYWKYGGSQKNYRAVQNNEMMAKYILASLTDVTKNQFIVAKHCWTLIDDDPTIPTNVAVAALFYKEIVRLTTLETRETNKALRDNLNALTEYCI